MSTYLLVHGAWHSGDSFQPIATILEAAGHRVYTPTLLGNNLGDSKRVSLDEVINSLVDYFAEHELNSVIAVGHSFGGMVITGVADRLPAKSIRRLVYCNAFVPNDGESVNDMLPDNFVELFEQVEAKDGSISLPYPIWRDGFINDADAKLAKQAFKTLNSQSHATFTDKIKLSNNPADMKISKSYLYCTEDTSIPHSLGWHPRLSEKLGFFRFVTCPGSHEVLFTNPTLLAEKIIQAGRD